MSATGADQLPLLDGCPCAGSTLDRLIQPAVLVVLAEGPLHGYRLAERIGGLPTFGGQPPDPSGVYRYLKTLQSRGYVTATWDLSESGPPKKCYQITPAGQQCLARWIATLEHYRRGITDLLRAARRVSTRRDGNASPAEG